MIRHRLHHDRGLGDASPAPPIIMGMAMPRASLASATDPVEVIGRPPSLPFCSQDCRRTARRDLRRCPDRELVRGEGESCRACSYRWGGAAEIIMMQLKLLGRSTLGRWRCGGDAHSYLHAGDLGAISLFASGGVPHRGRRKIPWSDPDGLAVVEIVESPGSRHAADRALGRGAADVSRISRQRD